MYRREYMNKIFICDNCPCLGGDELDDWCNLGYKTLYKPGFREYALYSDECKLVKIITSKEEIINEPVDE
jgi:hypothetical protein